MQIQNRRTFLQRAGIAAVGTGLIGCAGKNLTGSSSSRKSQKTGEELRVQIAVPADPLVVRAFAILKDRIQHRCSTAVVESKTRSQLVLNVDDRLPVEAFRIHEQKAAIWISGGSARGLLWGIGKFLRTSGYDDARFQPSSWRGTSAPQGTLRGIYFATHFHNWYHQATEAEIARYMEDLALWGVNAVMSIFPMINLQDWHDPQAEPAMARLRQTAKTARDLGLQFVTGLNNAFFINAPKSIRATPLPDPTRRRGNSGHPICPSDPQGYVYILGQTQQLFERLADVGLDAVMFWPYDEGGCACAKCSPWGSNGYLKLSRDQAHLGKRYFPQLKTILSTWMYDTPPEGEWQGLTDALAKEDQWVDYILADSHEDFPRYPLEVGVPANLPLLNFPEISMWGNWPWGGFGAHPLPGRVQRLWNQVKHLVKGGFPYSEGIYEDMNKAVVAQFYWNRDQSAQATLKEYISYEFGSGVTEEVLAIIETFENTASAAYLKQPVDVEAVRRAYDTAEALQNRLPEWAKNNWRWEILRLRALLDHERFVNQGLNSPAAEKALLRLIKLYHCQLETDDPYHHRVRPPLSRAVSRRGKL